MATRTDFLARPDYEKIHELPLPLLINPLPPLIPHNPISLLHIAYVYLFRRQQAQAVPLYIGQFDPATRSVHVTDPRSIQAFWAQGFFGKGSLSRSEPTWLPRRLRALGIIGKDENLTAEEITERRRVQRREFKQERARAERERIQRQLVEEGKAEVPMGDAAQGDAERGQTDVLEEAGAEEDGPAPPILSASDVVNLEHLALTLEEAFFLSFALGALRIQDAVENTLTNQELFLIFTQQEPQQSQLPEFRPDDTFMLNYVVYHHYRSLGWVVRPGIKFGVDYLLYNRGPVFSHAEFAVLILPSYSHREWNGEWKTQKEKMSWHQLHCVNRVQSQVKKTLLMSYVEIPPPSVCGTGGDIATVLKKYKVREFVLRRWLVNRSRD